MMNKKVLIVFAGLYLDGEEGAKHRLNCHINEYSERGYEVTVLAFCRSGLFRKDRAKYMNSNARWILMPYLFPKSKHIVLSRILDIYLGTVLSCVSWIRKFDIIQMEVQSSRIKTCRDSFYITDIHGDAVHEESETKNRSYEYWFVKYLVDIQKKITKNSNHCIVVSENLKRQIEINTNSQIKNYSIISCGVDFNRFANAKKQALPMDLSNKIVIGYSGGLQAWQNFDKMINIVIELRKRMPEIFFVVYTNNPTEKYKEKLDLLGEDNYYIKALLSSEVPGYLKNLDAGLLLRDDKILNTVSSPTKICEYLAAGVPVICTQYSGDYNRSIKNHLNGLILKEATPSDFEYEELIEWLRNVKSHRKEIGDICRNAASKRTFSEEFEKFINQIKTSVPL